MNEDSPLLQIKRSWLSLLLLLVGSALFLTTLGASYADLGGAFSPVFFPRIILAGWIVLAVLSVVADVLSSNSNAPGQWLIVVIVSVGLFAYIKLMPVAGFFLSSVLFSIVVLVATGQRNPISILLFSLAVPGALTVLFNHLLTMPLPVSPFFWWL
ncbi:MAG: tripartite tricarboxylate transporter TctB family protein [Granulosicoccus sp.]